ncbi:MAG: DUF805 domain-containing protein [Planctomycetes bacterium]|nr:DUF805 domain-containing protein [Planctomycetota bacterium]
MSLRISDLWTWQGTLDRGPYAAWGLGLSLLQAIFNNLLAWFCFGRSWPLTAFLLPEPESDCDLAGRHLNSLVLLAALPFVAAGLALTLRRLRSAAWPSWLVLFFFVPLLNAILFAALILAPTQARGTAGNTRRAPWRLLADFAVPEHPAACVAVAALLTLTLLETLHACGLYTKIHGGIALFAATPFWLGFFAVLCYGYHQRRAKTACLALAVLSFCFVSVLPFLAGLEALTWTLGLLLLASPLAALGGWAGYEIHLRFEHRLPGATRPGAFTLAKEHP